MSEEITFNHSEAAQDHIFACSFCLKKSSEVARMFVGYSGNICLACIDLLIKWSAENALEKPKEAV